MINYFVQKRVSPKDESVKYYAQAGKVTPLTLNEVAEAISNECTVTPHDVKAVLSALEEQLILAFQSGKSVRLGDIGSFHVTISSKGSATAAEVGIANINAVRVQFTKSAKMKSALRIAQNPKIGFRLIQKDTGKVTKG